MKALLVIAVLATVVVLGISLLIGDREDAPRTATTADRSTVGLRPVPAPQVTASQINRQDRPYARRQHEEAQAFDRRPLLNVLPTTVQSVRFDIGGLAADGRTTIIRAHAEGLGQRRVRIAYAMLRRRTGDRSRSYRLEIGP